MLTVLFHQVGRPVIVLKLVDVTEFISLWDSVHIVLTDTSPLATYHGRGTSGQCVLLSFPFSNVILHGSRQTRTHRTIDNWRFASAANRIGIELWAESTLRDNILLVRRQEHMPLFGKSANTIATQVKYGDTSTYETKGCKDCAILNGNVSAR